MGECGYGVFWPWSGKSYNFLAESESYICCLIAGPRESKFSVQFHHGGYFVGEGVNRAYVDGRVV